MKKSLLAVLVAFLCLNGCANPADPTSGSRTHHAATAVYPEQTPYPNEEDYFNEKTGDFDYEAYEADYLKWEEGKRPAHEAKTAAEAAVAEMTPFVQRTAVSLLSGAGGENRAYSPLNLYFALGMLAEITAGSSRTQVLDLMGAASTMDLREDIAALWLSNYSDDGRVTSILANSLWLSDRYTFEQPTLDVLAQNHRASSFRGTMGDEAFTGEFRAWMNEQTGGLLEDSVNGLEFSTQTVLALASTIYYAAGWRDEFPEFRTDEQTFHAPTGDVTCEFLNETTSGSYYWGENFAATAKYLEGNGKMWLILPDEGVTPEDLLADEEVTALYTGGETSQKMVQLNLSVPKFDVSSNLDLIDTLSALGVKDVFDAELADFSPVTHDGDGLAVMEAKHAARVMIDEEGCLAAAYTVMMIAETAMMPPEEEVDLILDRPFLFVLTGDDGAVLFMGIVNQP